MNESLRLAAPALTLTAFALLQFALDAWGTLSKATVRRLTFGTSFLALIAAGALVPGPRIDSATVFGRGMLIWDGLSYFVTWLGLFAAGMTILLSPSHRAFHGLRLAAYNGLMLLATVGVLFVGLAQDWLMILIAIELVGIPSFIVTAYLRRDARSAEAGIKFFLIGAFSTAMLVYGISLLYGLLGSTSLAAMSAAGTGPLETHAALSLLALFLILVSFGFKIALVPFHMWVPDVFDGAPTPIAAFLSVAPKIAGAAVALRVFTLILGSSTLGLLTVLAVLAALSMTVANLIGLQQTNVIRLLAYSSIAHMGYMLLGLVAGGGSGTAAFYLYGLAYLVMNLGAFAIVISVCDATGTRELSGFAGLARRSPYLSALLVLFLISLAGIPPTAGFVAKFYAMAAAYEAGWLWLVIFAGVNTVIGVGYYFKLAHAMYFRSAESDTPVELALPVRLVLALTSFATLLLGLAPDFATVHVQRLAGSAPVLERPRPCCGEARSVEPVAVLAVTDDAMETADPYER